MDPKTIHAVARCSKGALFVHTHPLCIAVRYAKWCTTNLVPVGYIRLLSALTEDRLLLVAMVVLDKP
eukprot:42351-Eustigmatos_ZCMA.PRE.1